MLTAGLKCTGMCSTPKPVKINSDEACHDIQIKSYKVKLAMYR